MSFATGAPNEQIMELASLAFIRRGENVILLSDRRGVGKTHLVIALGYLATRQGYKPRFFTADLVPMLEASQRRDRNRGVMHHVVSGVSAIDYRRGWLCATSR